MRITNNDIARFTEGECHYLARAIHLLTGWDIHCFQDDGQPYMHAFVLMPNGNYLDVEGEKTLKDMREWSGHKILPFTWQEIRESWGWYRPETSYTYRRAKELAAHLVIQYG